MCDEKKWCKYPKVERDWYRCTTRDEMVVLVAMGFDYANCRKDKFNNGDTTYFFERTKKLEKFLEMRRQIETQERTEENERNTSI